MQARTSLLAGLLACTAAAAPHAIAQDASFKPGAAVRFNYVWRDYGPAEGNNDFDLELIRAEATGSYGAWSFSAQYRWYEDFDAIHHAWVGYRLDASQELRAGIVQIPFGLLPYASHSFWFGSGYYLGLEDDYDLGAVWQNERWHLALVAGDEYGSGARYERYSFDVARTADLPYRERERVHVRYAHPLGDEDRVSAEVGASAFVGRVEHTAARRHETQWGGALHTELRRGPASLQLQWAHYDYALPGNRIALSAFMFPFEIAAEADVLTANVAWAFQRTGWLDSITCYNDLSTTQVSGDGLADSWQNVTGCSFGKGPMYTYVDWIAGRNMWFVGGPGVGIDEPGGDRWRSRLNVNVGFYF